MRLSWDFWFEEQSFLHSFIHSSYVPAADFFAAALAMMEAGCDCYCYCLYGLRQCDYATQYYYLSLASSSWMLIHSILRWLSFVVGSVESRENCATFIRRGIEPFVTYVRYSEYKLVTVFIRLRTGRGMELVQSVRRTYVRVVTRRGVRARAASSCAWYRMRHRCETEPLFHFSGIDMPFM
jgi:hypothetical protein